MSVNKIVTKVDGIINKTIDFNDLKAGLAVGAHTITVEAYNSATLISTQTRNITIAAAVSSYEAETTSYMNVVGIPNDTTVYYATTTQEITGAAIWTAVDNYVKSLKDNLIYSKFKAIYPLIGDTVLQMKWNLKNPLDTDAAFRLAFFGSGILSATGWKGNGANAYLETFLNQSTHITANSESVGYYLRTSSSVGFEGGVLATGNIGTSFIIRPTSFFRCQSGGERSLSLANTTGLIAISRLNSTNYKVQSRDNLTLSTQTSTTRPNKTFWIGDINGNSSPSNKEYAFSYISEGLTDAELLSHNTAVENLQTALKRNVA